MNKEHKEKFKHFLSIYTIAPTEHNFNCLEALIDRACDDSKQKAYYLAENAERETKAIKKRIDAITEKEIQAIINYAMEITHRKGLKLHEVLSIEILSLIHALNPDSEHGALISQQGGIAKNGTLALLGFDKEPEFVIPLEKLNQQQRPGNELIEEKSITDFKEGIAGVFYKDVCRFALMGKDANADKASITLWWHTNKAAENNKGKYFPFLVIGVTKNPEKI